MWVPEKLLIFGHNAWNSELSKESDSRLFEGSKLEAELEESDESNEDGDREVVMYPNPYNRRSRNAPPFPEDVDSGDMTP